MVRRLINSKEVIAKTIKEFNILTSDWLPYAGEIINSAMQYMNIKLPLEQQTKKLTIADYKTELPCEFNSLIAVEYDGYKIELGSAQNFKRFFYEAEAEEYPSLEDKRTKYNVNNNFIYFNNVKEGECILHYTSVSREFDEELNVYYPCIPDIEKLKEALKWYIIRSLILSGYKHPIIDFQTADFKWTQEYPNAQNACKSFTYDERHRLAVQNNNIVPSTDINYNDAFYIKN